MITYNLTEDNLKRVGLKPSPYDGVSNGLYEISLNDSYDPDKLPIDVFSVSKYLVDRVTGIHNQDVSIMINGDKGTGKSNLSLSLGHHCAVLLAKKLGGHWSDYFSVDNMAIMDTGKLIDLFDSDKTNQVIVSDDGGINNDSHKFMSNQSIDIVHMIVATRPKHNIYIITAPDQQDVNKTERNTADFLIQMVDNGRAMNNNFTVFKFKKRVRDTTTGKKYYKYLYFNDAKILRCVCPRAPPCLEMQYDKLRAVQMKKLTSKVKAKKDGKDGKLEPEADIVINGNIPESKLNNPQNAHTRRCEARVAVINKRIYELKTAGYNNNEIRNTICNELKLNIGTWYGYKRRNLLDID